MGGWTRRQLLSKGALAAGGLLLGARTAKGYARERDGDTPPSEPPQTIDSSKYFCSFLEENDKRHFHLTGYMQCFGNECANNGELPYTDGGFGKTYWRNSPDGVRRFVNMKGSRAPSEFFSIQGNSIFLEEEVMTWDPMSNNEYRDHHDKRGAPNHLWGSTADVPGRFVSPNIGDFYWRYCDKSKPDEFIQFHDGGYKILGPFTLSTGSLNDLEYALLPYGIGIDRKWLTLGRELGKPDASVEIIVRVNYWAPFGSGRNATPDDWAYQECYYYGALRTGDNLEGLGYLRWSCSSHDRPNQPLFLWKQGTLNKVVWEPDDNHLIALNLCEQGLPSHNDITTDSPIKPMTKPGLVIARATQRK